MDPKKIFLNTVGYIFTAFRSEILLKPNRKYLLSKFPNILFVCISITTLLLSSCNVSNNDTKDTPENLANTKWVLEYIQTPDEILFPGDDFFSIEFIGEDSIATYTPDDTLSSRAICIICFGNYKISMPNSIQILWMCNFIGRPPSQCRSDIGFKYYELTSKVYAFRKDRQTLQLFSKPDTSEQTYTMYFNIVVP